MCCGKATSKISLCKKYFEAYDQTVINFISLTNENKYSKDNSYDYENLQEPHDSDDDMTVDRDFVSKNNQNNHVCSNDSDYFPEMCDPPNLEHDDITEANPQNSFTIGVVEDK